MLSFFILLSWFLFILVIYKILGNKSIIINFAISWWYFWNFLSSFSLTGFLIPGVHVQLILFIFFSFFVIGVYSHNKILIIPLNRFINKTNISSNYRFLMLFLLVIISPIMLQFLDRTYYLLSNKYDPSTYRSEVLGLITGTSELFYNSTHISSIYWLVIHPILWMALIVGTVNFIQRRSIFILIIAIVLWIMDSIITVGRFGIHQSIMTILALGVYEISNNGFKIFKNKNFIIASSFILLLIILMLSIRKGHNLDYIINFYLLGYHTSSFSILDIELNDPQSIIFDKTLGKSFLSGLFNFPRYISNHLLGISWHGESDAMGGYLHPNRLLGYNKSGEPLYYNAFGSIFFSIFRDGRYIGTALYGLFFGYTMGLSSKGLQNKNPLLLGVLVSFFYILIYGLFQPVTSGAILPALFLVIMYYSIPVYSKWNK